MCTATATPAVAKPDGSTVVINEVYGGGGNAGATLTHDFIELYNPTDAPIDVSTWSVQYASSSGTSWQVTNLDGVVPAGSHYLVQEAQGKAGSEALPTPDVVGVIPISATKGKVALVAGTDKLDGCATSCAAADGVIDFVGFGSANDYEGDGAAPTLRSTTSAARTPDGVDTDDNAADFTAGAPTPQNTGSDDDGGGDQTVTVTDPGDQDGTVGTPIDPITLAASGGTAPYTWTATNLPDGLSISTAGIISGTPTTADGYHVTVTATDADDATGSTSFWFDIGDAAKALAIADIQGTDTDTSPQNGKPVITEGVVTATYPTGGLNGFYLQTAGTGGDNPDRTPGASDAIFVYGSQSVGDVAVGDSVQVSGTVSEYNGTTEITYPTVTHLDTPLAEVQPTEIVWDHLDTDAEKEAHEGEWLAPQGTFTVSSNYDVNYYGTFVLAAGDTPLLQPTDVGPAGSVTAKETVEDNDRRRIILDDGSSWNYAIFGSHTGDPLPYLTADNPGRVGSTAAFPDGVILAFGQDGWAFQPRHQVTDSGTDVVQFSGNTRADNERPEPVGGDIRLATFNVENYFPMTGERFESAGLGTCTWYTDREGTKIGVDRCTTADGGPGPRGAATAESLDRQQTKIVTGINHLDASIVSLEEVENSVKFGEDRDAALTGLVDALNAAAGDGTWAYVPSPDADALPTVAQQDVIRTAFIYRPAEVAPVGESVVLAGKSGPGQSFSIAREPLAQAFKGAGASDADSFLVVANHFKSKGPDADTLFDDCPNGGDVQDTDPAADQGAFNCTRVHEATDLAQFADQTAHTVGTDRIFLLGDFNAYTHEDPMLALYDAGYTDLGSAFDPSEQTYNYNDLAGSLDHVLANQAALGMVTGADVWQINAQESVAYAYSRYNYNVTQLFDAGHPFAASDHDPVIVGLTLPAPTAPAWDAHTVYTAGDEVVHDGSTWRALWWTQNERPGSSPWGAWEEIVSAPDGTAVWTPTRIFTAGDVVAYQGQRFVAQWWTRNQVPGDPWGPWQPMTS